MHCRASLDSSPRSFVDVEFMSMPSALPASAALPQVIPIVYLKLCLTASVLRSAKSVERVSGTTARVSPLSALLTASARKCRSVYLLDRSPHFFSRHNPLCGLFDLCLVSSRKSPARSCRQTHGPEITAPIDSSSTWRRTALLPGIDWPESCRPKNACRRSQVARRNLRPGWQKREKRVASRLARLLSQLGGSWSAPRYRDLLLEATS